MGYENFTSGAYTQFGANFVLAPTAIMWINLQMNYEDFVFRFPIGPAPAHTEEYSVQFEFEMVAWEAAGEAYFCIFSDEIDPIRVLNFSGTDYQYVMCTYRYLELGIVRGGAPEDSDGWTAGPVLNTRYYCTLTRSLGGIGVEYALFIRTGSHTGVLRDTLNCASNDIAVYDEFMPVASYDVPTDTYKTSGFMGNVDLGMAAPRSGNFLVNGKRGMVA